ncbi:MAG: diaminopimelate decarboxylase, partial [Lautropia sp.]|nr:diaminopimelate decarboxylase [Lautropia sp.]
MNPPAPLAGPLPDWLSRDPSGCLMADGLGLESLARQFGTPLYVYSRRQVESTVEQFRLAVKGRNATICYALKANSTVAIIELMGSLGCGFDIVSGGELERVIAAGCDPRQVLFSGVGKSASEMSRALEVGVRCFNVESLAELERLNEVAGRLGKQAPVSIRVNPDVDAATHPYISTGLKQNKFGVCGDEAVAVYRRAASLPHIAITGIDCHIGSQITAIEPFLAALDRVLQMADRLRQEGIGIQHLDLGGGLGIRYSDETPPAPMALMDALFSRIDKWSGGAPPEVLFEFGRALVGNAGLLLTRTEYLKRNQDKNFAIVDAAMNDLLRPSLYQAYHHIEPVAQRDSQPVRLDVVGPICESSDWLGRDRLLAIEQGDLLAILAAGAYGSVMSSNYNSRPRAA